MHAPSEIFMLAMFTLGTVVALGVLELRTMRRRTVSAGSRRAALAYSALRRR